MRCSLILVIALCGACVKKKLEESVPPSAGAAPVDAAPARHLYVASGVCYSGPNTTFTAATAANSVYRIDLGTGAKAATLADYWSSPGNGGDSPVGVSVDGNGEVKILVENASVALRRIERMADEADGERAVFSANVTALNQNLRGLHTLATGDLLVTKRTGVEYFTANATRVGAPFGNPSVAPCAASNSGITRSFPMADGKIIFLHAATGQNRIGVLAANGGTTCLAAQPAPTAAAFPTAGFYDEASGTLVVAYAGASTAVDLNSIYAYDVDAASGVISNPRKLYDANGFPAMHEYLLFSISEMTYDAATGDVYIATAVNTATTVANYQIEKFRYDPSKLASDPAAALEKSAGTFYPHGSDTKCISQMVVR